MLPKLIIKNPVTARWLGSVGSFAGIFLVWTGIAFGQVPDPANITPDAAVGQSIPILGASGTAAIIIHWLIKQLTDAQVRFDSSMDKLLERSDRLLAEREAAHTAEKQSMIAQWSSERDEIQNQVAMYAEKFDSLVKETLHEARASRGSRPRLSSKSNRSKGAAQ